jgi:hypothetical protein
LVNTLTGQELLNILEKEENKEATYAESTFSFSRLTFGHSVQTRKKGVLDVFIANRFWDSPAERSQSFIVDLYSGRFGFDYGITDDILVGVGYSNFNERFDAFIKYKVAKQQINGKKFPLSIALLQSASYALEEIAYLGLTTDDHNEFSFTSKVILARKFTNKLSFQIVPTYIYRSIAYSEAPNQHFFAIGFGGRYKLGRHLSLVSEYYYRANPIENIETYSPFSIGVNWEVSKVMVQLMLTNTFNMVEDAFILETPNNFNFRTPNLNFGFNFTYTFHLNNALKNKDN